MIVTQVVRRTAVGHALPNHAVWTVALAREYSNIPTNTSSASSPLGPGIAYGPGGRSSISGITATVFGATGFAGRYIVNSIARIGSRVVIPYRGVDYDIRHLKLMGDLGQIVPLPFHLRDIASIERAVSHSNVVVNAAGLEFETTNFSFTDIHVEGTRAIVTAAKNAGVQRFIHFSSAGASKKSPSAYYRSKAEGEDIVRSIFPNATILRPCAMFGKEDRLFNKYAGFVKTLAAVPLVEGGKAKRQPVYVLDVAAALMNCLRDETTAGKTYELGGPTVLTIEQIVAIIFDALEEKSPVIPVPLKMASLMGRIAHKIPSSRPLLTEDEALRMTLDQLVSPDALNISSLGITPTPVEKLIRTLMLMYKKPSLEYGTM